MTSSGADVIVLERIFEVGADARQRYSIIGGVLTCDGANGRLAVVEGFAQVLGG